MEKLNQRTDKFSIVLNDTGADVFKSANHIKRTFCTQDDLVIIYCACIMHDKDEEDNHIKTKHYHLLLHVGSICRLGTMINFICDLFHCNENQVSIEKCNSLEMQTRYLVHLDDFDKYHYNKDDIATNDVKFVDKCMNYIKSIATIDDLIAIVTEHKNNLLKLMSVIGYENYKRYRVVIADIRREILGAPIK